jgi:hypothetical protein
MSGNYCFRDVLRMNEYNTIEMYLEVCICLKILILEMCSRGMTVIQNNNLYTYAHLWKLLLRIEFIPPDTSPYCIHTSGAHLHKVISRQVHTHLWRHLDKTIFIPQDTCTPSEISIFRTTLSRHICTSEDIFRTRILGCIRTSRHISNAL